MNNAPSMSADVISLCAYAKINLHLKVFAKRADGFHNLESIFQRISIADYLSIEKMDDPEECVVESPLLPLPSDNTLVHAWQVFRKAAGIHNGIQIRLLKNIPAGSGLGGGSSDAAALLCGANQLFNTQFSNRELQRLALQVGSDVPFFLDSAAAIVTGRGELFEALPPRADCFGILIWSDVQSSTQEAYRLLDEERKRALTVDDSALSTDLAAQYQAAIASWQFVNDFQAVIEVRYPVVAAACDDLYRHNALFARMSGSGSAVFGLFATEKTMADAFCLLKKKWKWCKPFILLAL